MIKGYKGFGKDMKCRGFQFQVGGEYEESDAIACEKGFHFCEFPFDVFNYYPPSDSRYAEVEGDRHPQTMLRRVEKEDRDVDEAFQKHQIAWRTIDKQTAEDLTPEDVFALKAVAAEISQEIIAQLNLLIEWEDRYKLGLLDIFRQKNNRQVAI